MTNFSIGNMTGGGGGGKTDGKGGMNSGRVRDKQLKEEGIDKIGQYIVDEGWVQSWYKERLVRVWTEYGRVGRSKTTGCRAGEMVGQGGQSSEAQNFEGGPAR